MQVDGKLGFSLYEIMGILGLPKKGENYRDVRKAILRIGKLQIDFFNSHYSKEEFRYGSEHYSPWRVHFEANADKFGRASVRIYRRCPLLQPAIYCRPYPPGISGG